MDQTYNEEMFKSKVNNMMIQILNAEMMQDLNPVRHFMNDDLEKKYEEKINQRKNINQRQMYDELNVSNIVITSKRENDEKYIVEAKMEVKYMDYILTLDGDFVKGNQQSRSIHHYHVIFEKVKDYQNFNIVRKCKNCGHSMNIHLNGTCSYCGSVYNLEDYDYIMTDIIEL